MMILYFSYNRLLDRIPKKSLCWLIGLVIMGIILMLGLLMSDYSLLMYAVYWFIFLFGSYVAKYEIIASFIKKKSVYFAATVVLFLIWKIYPLSSNGVAWKSLANIVIQVSQVP